jgi:hypothetical protein
MPDVKDFDGIPLHAVSDDLRQALMQQFAGALLRALSSPVRKLAERADGLVNLDDRGMSKMRMVP